MAKVNYNDKVGIVPKGVHENQFWDTDANEIKQAINDNRDDFDAHVADDSNPHNVDKSDIGLDQVDNTSDLDKPISTAQSAVNSTIPARTSDLINDADDVGFNGSEYLKTTSSLNVTNRDKVFGNSTVHASFNGVYTISIGHFISVRLEDHTAIHIIIDNRASSGASSIVELTGWCNANPNYPTDTDPRKNSPIIEFNDQFVMLIDSSDPIGMDFDIPNKGNNNGVIPVYDTNGDIISNTTAHYNFKMYRVGTHPVLGDLTALKIENTVELHPFFTSVININAYQPAGISPEVLGIFSNNGVNIQISDL